MSLRVILLNLFEPSLLFLLSQHDFEKFLEMILNESVLMTKDNAAAKVPSVLSEKVAHSISNKNGANTKLGGTTTPGYNDTLILNHQSSPSCKTGRKM